MMKKIICLLLALLMIVPALVACGDDGDALSNVTDKASRYTNTINMWLITESETIAAVSDLAVEGLNPAKVATMSAEDQAKINALSEDEKAALSQLLAISNEINKITKAQFKTKVNLKYFTADEYDAKLEAAMVRHKEALDNGEISKQDPTSEETVYNEYGVPELKYPEAKDYQVDILFIGDQQKYLSYIQNGWLLSLNDKIADSAMELNTYITKLVLNAAQYDGSIYAVPNNHTVGEYTYLLVNKEQMEKYYFSTESFTTSSVYDPEFAKFLAEVYDDYKDKSGDEKIYPLYTENGELEIPFVHYWGYAQKDGTYILDPDAFSLFGSTYLNSDIRNNETPLTMSSILGSTVYKNFVDIKLTYEKTDGYITDDPTANAAAMVLTGGWEIQEQYGNEYEILVMGTPRATNEDIFSSMFAVSANSTSDDRAMEIITYLNTNPALRNLLQYGIEGVNYTLETVEEEVDGKKVYYEYAKVNTRDNYYVMDINKTGNVFIAYPDSADKVHMWEYGKKQNNEALALHTLSFALNTKEYKLDEKSLEVIAAVSAEVERYLDANVYSDSVTYEVATAAFAQIQSKAASSSTAPDAMAKWLLGADGLGLVVNYTYNGTTSAVDVATLSAAIAYMQKEEVIGKTDALESPNALYREWVTATQFAD